MQATKRSRGLKRKFVSEYGFDAEEFVDVAFDDDDEEEEEEFDSDESHD